MLNNYEVVEVSQLNSGDIFVCKRIHYYSPVTCISVQSHTRNKSTVILGFTKPENNCDYIRMPKHWKVLRVSPEVKQLPKLVYGNKLNGTETIYKDSMHIDNGDKIINLLDNQSLFCRLKSDPSIRVWVLYSVIPNPIEFSFMF